MAKVMTLKQRKRDSLEPLPNVAVKFLRFSGHRSQQGDNSLPAQDRGIDDYILGNPRHPLHARQSSGPFV